MALGSSFLELERSPGQNACIPKIDCISRRKCRCRSTFSLPFGQALQSILLTSTAAHRGRGTLHKGLHWSPGMVRRAGGCHRRGRSVRQDVLSTSSEL